MKIEFASEEDKLLFLKYAVPCGITLVNRGDITEAFLEDLSSKTASGDIADVDPEETFKIAVRMCYLTAKKLNKEKIDSATIRQYFWHDHKDAIKWRSEVFKDVRLDTCSAYAGRVTFVGEFVTVKTDLGIMEFRKDFIPDVQRDDYVITHYDYIVEKISEEEAKAICFTL